MLAYIYTQYGGPDVLRQVEIPTPTPKDDEILVRICATTVSSGDWRVRSLTVPPGFGILGRLMFGIFGPRKPILGTDFSGVVEATGTDVTKYNPGDEVVGFPGESFGAHAEYITMKETGMVTPKPSNLTHKEAVAILFGGMTAYDFLYNRTKINPNEKVLINGASGSVGTACVQVAKSLGATVTGVCSAKNAELVRSLGADHVIEYQKTDVVTEGHSYDLIVDTASTLPWKKARQILRPNGRLIGILCSAQDMFFANFSARREDKQFIAGAAKETPEILQAVMELASQKTIQSAIDSCYTFDEMVEAHRRVDTGRKVGSVVVILEPQKVLK